MKQLKTKKAFSTPFKPLIAAALILAVFAPSVAGQDIHLQSRTITSGGSDSFAVQPTPETDSDAREHFIVQFEDSVAEQERKSLEGVELLGYVPDNAWYASASTDRISELEDSDKVQTLVDLKPSDKISDSVKENSSAVDVDIFRDVEKSTAEEILQQHSSSVEHVSDNTWRVESPSVDQLAEEDAVKWIDSLPPKAESHIEDSRSLINANIVQNDYGLTGSGITAAIWDGGIAGDHRDLTYNGKRIVGDSAGISDHATHVAGVMLGGGVLDSAMRGIAPDAEVNTFQWPTSSTRELYSETAEAANNDAVVSQNSWGWSIGSYSDMGNYGSYARAYDSIVHGERNHQPLSVVFSAGNEGNDGWSSRYDTITGAGATAKNSITVGALTDSGGEASFSSWGPTDDGRIKPDLMANGYSVTSTMPGDNYGAKSGTSISAPAVSGAVILVNQAFEDAYGSTPAPETVKAALIQTAEDLESEGPDYETGWGQVNVESAVDLVQNGQIETGTLDSEGSSKTYKFDASDGAKFTLVWSDHPGETSAGKALVNDLDLEVRDSNGNRYYPYTLDPGNPSAAADQSSEDERNPVEQVRVPSGAGEVTVTVDAENMPEPAQDFTLVTEAQKTDGDAPTDPEPPEPLEINVESPESKTYSADPVMQLTTSTEAEKVYWSPNGGYWYHMNQESDTEYRHTHDFREGENTVEFYAETSDGETTREKVTFEVQSQNSDTTPPELTVNSPEQKTYQTNGVTFSLESNEELDRAWYELDSGQSGGITGSGTSFQEIVQLDDGSYTATLYGEDKAGNTASEQVDFSVDTTEDSQPEPIDLEIGSPTSKTYTDSPELQITTSKEAEAAYWSPNGGYWYNFHEQSGNDYRATHEFDKGQNTVEFYARDEDGNTVREEVKFTVDKDDGSSSPDPEPPEITVESPESKTYQTSGIQLSISSDKELAKAEYSVDGQSGMLTERNGQHTDMINLEDGQYTVEFRVEDQNGNANTEKVDFTVDTSSDEPDDPRDNPNDSPGDDRDSSVDFEVMGPESKTYSTSGVLLSIEAEEDLERVFYFLDGQSGMLDQDGDLYTEMVNLEDGQHTVEFEAKDEAGNTRKEKVTFEIDTDGTETKPADTSGGASSYMKPVEISVGDTKTVQETQKENNSETAGHTKLVSEQKQPVSDPVDAVSPDAEDCQTFDTSSEVPEAWEVIEEGCNEKQAQTESNPVQGLNFSTATSFDSLKSYLLKSLDNLLVKGSGLI